MSKDDVKAATRPQPGTAGDGSGRMAKLSAATMSRTKEEPNQLLVLMGDAEGAPLSYASSGRYGVDLRLVGCLFAIRIRFYLSSSFKHNNQYVEYRHVFSRPVVGVARL